MQIKPHWDIFMPFYQISDWKNLKPGCGQKDVLVIAGKLV